MKKFVGFLIGLFGILFAMVCWCYALGFITATILIFFGWLLFGGSEIINE